MNVFIDTSALIKYYYNEAGTEEITEIIDNEENNIFISEIAKIEFSCSLFRKFRNNEISDSNLELALSAFNESLTGFTVEPVSNLILREAEQIIIKNANKFAIRTLDSIHTATFKVMSELDWRFAASDKSLLFFLKNMNISILEI